ncbi:MAG TPA: SPOR domain-containing protein [Rhizomicrobium sp.]|jgi:hypothetical protein
MPTNYEPSDDVRVFNGGDDEEDVEGSRLPLLIVIALLVLAAFGGVVWLAYQRGVQQGHAEVPRVIAAEPGPAKVAPMAPGGTPTPYTGLKIYQQPAPANENASATPAPSRSVAANPAPPAPAATKPAPIKAPATVVDAAPVKPAQAKPAPMAAASPATSKPTSIRPAEGGTKPVAVASPDLTPFATLPPTQPKAAGRGVPPAQPPAVGSGIPPAQPTAAGSSVLQIGAYKSEADAGAAWVTYKAKHATLLTAMTPDVKQVDLGAKGIWYRLRILVSDKSSASALCEKLKTEGGACIPSK